MAPGTDVKDLLPDTALTGPNGITSAPAVLKEPMLKVVLPCLRRSSPKAKFLVHYSFSSLVAQMRMWAARSDGPGCKSGLPSFWSFYPSLRRACLLHFLQQLGGALHISVIIPADMEVIYCMTNTYTEEKTAHWLTDGGIEDEWDDYVSAMDSMGLQDVVAAWQAAYDRYVEAQ